MMMMIMMVAKVLMTKNILDQIITWVKLPSKLSSRSSSVNLKNKDGDDHHDDRVGGDNQYSV